MPALRVAIDLTALAQYGRRPSAESLQVRFAEALTRQAPVVQFAVLTRPQTYAALAHLDAPNVRRLRMAEPSPFEAVLARLEARLQRRFAGSRVQHSLAWIKHLALVVSRMRADGLAELGVDVIFCPFTTSGFSGPSVPVVVALDDLQHVSHPHLLTSHQRASRARAYDATSRRAARIVCSTRSLRDVALQSAGALPERVVTIAPGRLLAQPPLKSSASAATLPRHRLEENRFFLLVGDFEPRHNHRVALAAWAIFRARHPDSTIRLVCVGGPETDIASFKTIAKRMGLGASVQFAGPLDRDELSVLIGTCRAVVVPSLYETIGETVVEAMQFGRPVLCSHIPGLAELAGSAAFMFDAHRPAELAVVFERAENDPALLNRLGQLGRERVATLDDPQAVAEAYVGAFNEARTTCPRSR